jgi:hypothetical protein
VTCSNVAAVDTDHVATVSLGVVGNAGVVTSRAEGTIDAHGLQRANARAETAGVNLLGGLVTADVVEAVASVRGDANGGVTPRGSATSANLRVAGVPVVDPRRTGAERFPHRYFRRFRRVTSKLRNREIP